MAVAHPRGVGEEALDVRPYHRMDGGATRIARRVLEDGHAPLGAAGMPRRSAARIPGGAARQTPERIRDTSQLVSQLAENAEVLPKGAGSTRAPPVHRPINNPFRDTSRRAARLDNCWRPRGAKAKGFSAHNPRIPEFRMVLELMAEDARGNVDEHELKVRPPTAPTTDGPRVRRRTTTPVVRRWTGARLSVPAPFEKRPPRRINTTRPPSVLLPVGPPPTITLSEF